MANEEQLTILEQAEVQNDVEIWNRWRADNPNIDIDLSEAPLNSSNLTRVNLRGAKLSGAHLQGCTLFEADLRGADLREADLEGAHLQGADLSEANLSGASLRKADLTHTNLLHADLTGANLAGVVLDDAGFFEVDVSGANLHLPVPEYPRVGRGRAAERLPPPKDEFCFTAIYPKEGTVDVWHTLLVYSHLRSWMEDVREDARLFKDHIPLPKEYISSSLTDISPSTELTIVPSCEGLIFSPERIVITWNDYFYQRADFRFRADKLLSNDTVRGQINIYSGPIVVGTLRLAMLFSETDAQFVSKREVLSRRYHQEDIFVSYSHKDSRVVLACKKAYEALGFKVLMDIDTLRSGQVWNEELMRMIDRATIFQLFWSENSAQSKYCRQEWEHALKRNKEGFIRPVYWEIPMPKPPEELSQYHFAFIEL